MRERVCNLFPHFNAVIDMIKVAYGNSDITRLIVARMHRAILKNKNCANLVKIYLFTINYGGNFLVKVSMNIRWSLILAVFLLAIPANAHAQGIQNPFLIKPDTGWEKVPMENSNGVEMFNRKSIVEGAKFQDCKGVVTIKTTLNSIIRLLEDTEVSHLWMHNCVEGRKVSEDDTKNESVKQFKTEKKGVFITSKYDSVVRDTRLQDITTKVVTISITIAYDLVPKDPEYNRIEKLYGKWELIPITTNEVKVIYELYSEPSGGGVVIGNFLGLVEPGLREHMLENLKGMKEVLECRHKSIGCQKYKEGKVYVQEL